MRPTGWLTISLVVAMTSIAASGALAAGNGPSLSLAPGGLLGEVSATVGQTPDAAALAPRPLSLEAADSELLALGGLGKKKPKEGQPAKESDKESAPLSAERAQVLLRSLTFPGWGQATLGHDRSAKVFALAEAGIWISYTAFRVQAQMRTETTERTARLLAGIDLDGRDEEFRRVVGAYISSDEYNQLVVYRDAANQYYDDPAAYRQYIADHSLKGSDVWKWDSEESLVRYRAQRRNVTQATQRANTVLAVAIANRLLSALHVARIAHLPKADDGSPRSLRIEMTPSDPNDATAYRLGVHTRF